MSSHRPLWSQKHAFSDLQKLYTSTLSAKSSPKRRKFWPNSEEKFHRLKVKCHIAKMIAWGTGIWTNDYTCAIIRRQPLLKAKHWPGQNYQAQGHLFKVEGHRAQIMPQCTSSMYDAFVGIIWFDQNSWQQRVQTVRRCMPLQPVWPRGNEQLGHFSLM